MNKLDRLAAELEAAHDDRKPEVVAIEWKWEGPNHKRIWRRVARRAIALLVPTKKGKAGR